MKAQVLAQITSGLDCDSESTDTGDTVPDESAKSKSVLSNLLSDFSSPCDQDRQVDPALEEINGYLAEKACPADLSPLQW